MSNRAHQKQQEQASLLQSQDPSLSVVSDAKPISSETDQRLTSPTQKDQKDRPFDQTTADLATQSFGILKKDYQTDRTDRTNLIGYDCQTFPEYQIRSTQSQPTQEPEMLVQSDGQRECRQMRERDELKFQEWKRQKQIDFKIKVKKMQEKVQLQRLQRKEERQRRIAMNTSSDQISFFQNIKRFLGIAQRNDKKNK